MSPRHDRSETVLVIDDMPDLCKMLTRHLVHWGYRALCATSGNEGLQIAETEQPDLILLDILLPKMKGREVCARLKANPRTRSIPVIFLTALGLADHVKTGMALGADDYILKPFRHTDLRERIRIGLLRNASRQRGQAETVDAR